MLLVLYGFLPGLRARPTLQRENPAYLSGLPQLFAARDYCTRYLQGAPLIFDDKESFFKKRGFAQVDETSALFELFSDADYGDWQGPHDEYIFAAHGRWLREKDSLGESTFSVLLTITNHAPWKIPRTWRNGPLADDTAYRAQLVDDYFDANSMRRELALR